MLTRSKPMNRGKGLKRPAHERKPAQRKCKVCAAKFAPTRGIQSWCSPECGVTLATKLVGEKQAREHRAKLADSKPLSHWLDLTQRAVNAYVLARDDGKPCISCGCWDAYAWDAGHYLSRGARPELRFELENIARQCAACNRHKGGNQTQYRLGLLARIGVESVEALEGPHPPAKFTREGLEQLRRQIAAVTRALTKEREPCAA